jgi:hypothetical protein
MKTYRIESKGKPKEIKSKEIKTKRNKNKKK